jgi:hypothetical protein
LGRQCGKIQMERSRRTKIGREKQRKRVKKETEG